MLPTTETLRQYYKWKALISANEKLLKVYKQDKNKETFTCELTRDEAIYLAGLAGEEATKANRLIDENIKQFERDLERLKKETERE